MAIMRARDVRNVDGPVRIEWHMHCWLAQRGFAYSALHRTSRSAWPQSETSKHVSVSFHAERRL
jgi:hypothetical protein